MRTEVSYDDVIGGRPGCPSRCPVALAIRRRFPGLLAARVVQDVVTRKYLISLVWHKDSKEFWLDGSSSERIRWYDLSRQMTPFFFDLCF